MRISKDDVHRDILKTIINQEPQWLIKYAPGFWLIESEIDNFGKIDVIIPNNNPILYFSYEFGEFGDNNGTHIYGSKYYSTTPKNQSLKWAENYRFIDENGKILGGDHAWVRWDTSKECFISAQDYFDGNWYDINYDYSITPSA